MELTIWRDWKSATGTFMENELIFSIQSGMILTLYQKFYLVIHLWILCILWVNQVAGWQADELMSWLAVWMNTLLWGMRHPFLLAWECLSIIQEDLCYVIFVEISKSWLMQHCWYLVWKRMREKGHKEGNSKSKTTNIYMEDYGEIFSVKKQVYEFMI